MKVGRRLATKVLNASRFVLGFGSSEGAVTEPLDRSMLAQLSTVVSLATSELEQYDHTAALSAAESFFWRFCDDYIELVKERAYGTGPGADSARAALRLALSVQARLFAPFLPFVTEEVWSWFADGSVHRAGWPSTSELDGYDPELLTVVAEALSQVRRAKSERNLSMRADVALATVQAPAPTVARLQAAESDLRAAGRIAKVDYMPSDASLTVTATLS
jgi:valyl-tRNA synthetase